MPLVDSPFFEAIADSGWFDARERVLARELREQGYTVFDFDDPELPARAARIRQALTPLFDDAARGGERFDGRLMPPRFQDAWREHPDVHAIATHAPILQLLGKLYGRPAFPFQTLTFQMGSQQHAHSDGVHFNSWPPAFMCGVWVALEDVTDRNGPLFYYPGSHRYARFDHEHVSSRVEHLDRPASQAVFHDLWNELVAAHGTPRIEFRPRLGQALIWSANLLHGGAPILEPGATRWSQVTHFFFDNCAYYRPMASHWLEGRVAFIDPVDVRTGSPVAGQVAGRPLDAALRSDAARRVQAHEQRLQTSLPADFDPALYLELNRDVATAGADPAAHYVTHGRAEGRRYR